MEICYGFLDFKFFTCLRYIKSIYLGITLDKNIMGNVSSSPATAILHDQV